MMNDEMREELFEEVCEWMTVHLDWTKDFLEEIGEDWMRLYDIDDLFRDHCGNDLAELVDLFMDNNVEASNWTNYFFDEDGNLCDENELDEAIAEYVYNHDETVDAVIDMLDDGTCTNDELIAIHNKYAGVDWLAVEEAYAEKERYVILHYMDVTNEARMVGRPDMFVSACKRIADMCRMLDYLDATRFCGISENKYSDIRDHFVGAADDSETDMEVNAVYKMLDDVQRMATNGISIEKATEMYVKNIWEGGDVNVE